MSEEIHASFWCHVEELRKVLIRTLFAVCFGLIISFYFYEEILHFILSQAYETKMFLFSPFEGFVAIFRLSFWFGLIGTSPYWTWGIVSFLNPALKKNERRLLPSFFLLSGIFIACGIVLCFKVTLPLATQYLFNFNQTIGTNLWGFSSYLDFVLMLIFSHGVAFEIGAVLLLIVHLRVINSDSLKRKRRHAIVTSLIIGALLTPPDIFTQICVAIPLIIFYEFAILYSYLTRT